MHYGVGVVILKCMQIVLIKRVIYLENILYQLVQVVLLFLLDYKGVGWYRYIAQFQPILTMWYIETFILADTKQVPDLSLMPWQGVHRMYVFYIITEFATDSSFSESFAHNNGITPSNCTNDF